MMPSIASGAGAISYVCHRVNQQRVRTGNRHPACTARRLANGNEASRPIDGPPSPTLMPAIIRETL